MSLSLKISTLSPNFLTKIPIHSKQPCILIDPLHLFSVRRVSLAEYLFVLSVCVEMFFFSSAGGASGVEHQDSESMLSPYLSECSINS